MKYRYLVGCDAFQSGRVVDISSELYNINQLNVYFLN